VIGAKFSSHDPKIKIYPTTMVTL